MDRGEFISKLESALAEERAKCLAQKLKTNFAILKRQREGEGAPPSRLYWALKSMPEAVRVSYLKYLAGNTSEECIKAKEIVADRRRLFDPLDLMDWAEMPTVELSPEQAAKSNRRA